MAKKDGQRGRKGGPLGNLACATPTGRREAPSEPDAPPLVIGRATHWTLAVRPERPLEDVNPQTDHRSGINIRGLVPCYPHYPQLACVRLRQRPLWLPAIIRPRGNMGLAAAVSNLFRGQPIRLLLGQALG